jgi:hypothetical protein
MCSIGQLSPGAYFLRRDFFPSIVSVRLFDELCIHLIINTFMKLVKSPETEQFAFDTVLFLAILANYHKSDAAKLNPYLKRIRNSSDGDFMRQLSRASNSAVQTAIKYVDFNLHSTLSLIHFSAYQAISDDSTPAMSNFSLESVVTRLRPDRVLGLTPQLFLPEINSEDQ